MHVMHVQPASGAGTQSAPSTSLTGIVNGWGSEGDLQFAAVHIVCQGRLARRFRVACVADSRRQAGRSYNRATHTVALCCLLDRDSGLLLLKRTP